MCALLEQKRWINCLMLSNATYAISFLVSWSIFGSGIHLKFPRPKMKMKFPVSDQSDKTPPNNELYNRERYIHIIYTVKFITTADGTFATKLSFSLPSPGNKACVYSRSA